MLQLLIAELPITNPYAHARMGISDHQQQIVDCVSFMLQGDSTVGVKSVASLISVKGGQIMKPFEYVKNYVTFIFYLLKGFHDLSTLSRDKGGNRFDTNRESPCRYIVAISAVHVIILNFSTPT